MRRATRGWARATRWRSCSGTRRSTTAATCCSRSTGRARSTSRSRACRAGNAGRSNPRAFVAGETTPRPVAARRRPPVRHHARSPTNSTSRSRSPGCGSRPRSACADEHVVPRYARRLRRAQVRDAVRAVVERVVIPDAARQQDGLSHAYHPWFPVLLIGSHKAELYTRALIGDIVHKQRNLSDPGWLVRVGIYLELLTCLGIAEAVGEDLYGDLELPDLTRPAQRRGLEARVGAARHRVRRAAHRARSVRSTCSTSGARRSSSCTSTTRTCSTRSSSRARTSHNAQETWHRVFRDAERAVLRQTPDAFPELGHLPKEVRRWVLWHRLGHLGLSRGLRVPGPLAAAARRPGRAVRVRLQPVPRVDEPRRRLGQAARADGPVGRGGACRARSACSRRT